MIVPSSLCAAAGGIVVAYLEAEGLDVVDCVALEVPDNAGSLLRTRADVPAG